MLAELRFWRYADGGEVNCKYVTACVVRDVGRRSEVAVNG